MSLYWRIFLSNAAVLLVAVLLLLGPVTVSTPVLFGEALVLLAGLVVMLIANAVLLRVGLAPLGRLTRAMTTADLLRPGSRTTVTGPSEIAELTKTFNAMLARLEAERATSSGRALSAQEAERRRLARELHDEVGQTLTAVLLQLRHAADLAPQTVRTDLHQAQETTRAGLEEIRRIARRLRPGVLEELGLHSALRALTAEFTTARLRVTAHITPGLPRLDPDTELVLYRIAQESLTNTARHAGATRAEVHLRPLPDARTALLVRDNGRGIASAPEGAGINGMRERALLIGADLHIGPGPQGGTQISLHAATDGGATDGGATDGGATDGTTPGGTTAGGVPPDDTSQADPSAADSPGACSPADDMPSTADRFRETAR
ncbi:HAMP domain-containing sensor histidine kinase [Streptomyces europaeiscabiei]|uniref:HAMP domain-containing sensor histidine kinase n=1 Tax=Streptomyces europaeiscabiei TaxID=146819 RepID=UPI0029A3F3CB|nr:HAMP domain-containing sensor histidine kinase [Streptomyces europaeiscabiei]MDX3845188.1 HAMP domain-containing sensor histidine kinase [Streptomyces europaeiscabiei]